MCFFFLNKYSWFQYIDVLVGAATLNEHLTKVQHKWIDMLKLLEKTITA